MKAEGNCVAAMSGGEQPEAKMRSQTDQERSVNSIRYLQRASLRGKGEACRESGEPRTALGLSKLERGLCRYGWSENAWKGAWVKVGDRHDGLSRDGVRALIVVKKPGNAGGAKGRRKVKTR